MPRAGTSGAGDRWQVSARDLTERTLPVQSVTVLECRASNPTQRYDELKTMIAFLRRHLGA